MNGVFMKQGPLAIMWKFALLFIFQQDQVLGFRVIMCLSWCSTVLDGAWPDVMTG